MSAPAFQPLGEKSEWRLIFDSVLTDLQPGALVTYAHLDAALGRPFRDNRHPLYRAMREFGEARHRWLEAIPGQGYRVIEASEHVLVARRHKRKGQRQIGTALKVIGATAVGELTQDQRSTFDQLAMILHLQHSMLLSHETRITRVEGLLEKAGMG